MSCSLYSRGGVVTASHATHPLSCVLVNVAVKCCCVDEIKWCSHSTGCLKSTFFVFFGWRLESLDGTAAGSGPLGLSLLSPGLVNNIRRRGGTRSRRAAPFTPPSHASLEEGEKQKNSPYLRGPILGDSGGPVALRRAAGVGDAAVIFSRRLLALGVRPPRRVAFLNGARLLETPASQQISHLKKHANTPCSLLFPLSVHFETNKQTKLHHGVCKLVVCLVRRRWAHIALRAQRFKWQREGNFHFSNDPRVWQVISATERQAEVLKLHTLNYGLIL